MEAFWSWWSSCGWGVVAFAWIMLLIIRMNNIKETLSIRLQHIKEYDINSMERRVNRQEEARFTFPSRQEMENLFCILKERIAILETRLEERDKDV